MKDFLKICFWGPVCPRGEGYRMSKVCLWVVLLSVASSSAIAQDYLRGDIFAGYSYMNVQTNGLIPSRQNFAGWESSYTMPLSPRFGAETDFGANYRTIAVQGLTSTSSTSVDVALHDYSFLVGPRVNFRPMFLHALFGLDHLSGTGSGFAQSDNNFATAIGGGVQWRFSRYFALRTSADYMLTHHNIFGVTASQQNNFRASLGLVYQIGAAEHRAEVSHHPAPAAVSKPVPSGTISPTISPSGTVAPSGSASASKTSSASRTISGVGTVSSSTLGVVARTNATGAEIVQVTPGSVAEYAGLHPGDVVNAVDGKAIRNAQELEIELSNKAPGSTVELSYLIRGYWQTASTVTLQAAH
jgi:hypothetical protein